MQWGGDRAGLVNMGKYFREPTHQEGAWTVSRHALGKGPLGRRRCTGDSSKIGQPLAQLFHDHEGMEGAEEGEEPGLLRLGLLGQRPSGWL